MKKKIKAGVYGQPIADAMNQLVKEWERKKLQEKDKKE